MGRSLPTWIRALLAGLVLVVTPRAASAIPLNEEGTINLTVRAYANVRIGTAYFKDLVDRFGGAHYALASYNAGESRVVRWKAERPSLDEDEFIDDIPYPETQNYVKRILGTAEDYRLLYGKGGGRPIPVRRDVTKRADSRLKAQGPALSAQSRLNSHH